VALFRAWCYNSVATFSLCLLAQAYEQAYNLLQIFADLEMTVNMLIQIDKLVQLLESPVFTYLRLQLLEPDRYPYLYKCLYGLLMLLPQSSAFGALKNRLNSVSAIGLLHTPASMPTSARPSVVSGMASSTIPTASTTVGGRLSRTRDPNSANEVKWPELLDKFKQTQEKARRRNERLLRGADADTSLGGGRAPRSLLDGVDGGRSSRASAEDDGRGPGLGVSRGGSRVTGVVGTPGGQAILKAGPGLTANIGTGGGIAGDRLAPHKRGHSLAGGLGKFASGIARAGTKDREKGKK